MSKKYYWKNFKITDHIYISILKPENCCIPRRYSLLDQTAKQPLSNFKPRKTWKCKQLWGLTPDLRCFLSVIKELIPERHHLMDTAIFAITKLLFVDKLQLAFSS